MHYVAGFLFNTSRTRVALVRKNRPEYQEGKLNGVGGHVERGEKPATTMWREFHEEAGLGFTGWEHFATLCTTHQDRIDFFYGVLPKEMGELEDNVRTVTDEEIVVAFLADLPGMRTMPNVQWLVHMALSMNRGESSRSFNMYEVAR